MEHDIDDLTAGPSANAVDVGNAIPSMATINSSAVRAAIEAKEFKMVKFVDVPLPSDDGERSVSGGYEKIESIVRMDTENARYIAQMRDKRMQSPRIGEEFSKAEKLMPNEVLLSQININSLGFIEAMIWEKKYRRAAQNGEYYNITASSVDTDECWRRAMSCSIHAFSLEPKDLLLVQMLDDYHSRGLTAKFPDETARLLEIGMQMSEDKSGMVQLKFFEKYYHFQLNRGCLDEALEFLTKNIHILCNNRIMDSKIFRDILKKHPNGERILMEIYRRTFAVPVRTVPGRYRSDMSTYLINYELALNGGNYKAVEAALLDKNGNGHKFDDEAVRRNARALIPEYFDNYESSAPEANSLVTQTFITIDQGNLALSVKGLKRVYDSEAVHFDMYRACVVRFLRKFASPETCDNEEIVEALTQLSDAESDLNLKIPADLSNLILARLLEARYKQGKYENVIRIGGQFFAHGLEDKMLRGSAYYYMKSCFEIAGDDPAMIAEGIKAIQVRLPQFAGTEWEEEIWRDYLLPHYDVCAPRLIVTMKGQAGATAAIERIITKDPGNVNAQIALIRLIIINKKGLNRLPAMCRTITNTSTLLEVVETLSSAGMKTDTLDVMRMVVKIDGNKENVTRLCRLLLEPSRDFRMVAYEETMALVALHPALADELSAQLRTARERLNIAEYKEIEQSKYLDRLSTSNRAVEGIGGDDGVRIGFLASALREATAFYQEMLGNSALDWSKLQKDREHTASLDIFSIDKILFEKGPNGAVRVRLELKPDKPNSLDREFVVLEFDRDLRMKFVELKCSPEKAGHAKIFIHLLEAACLEEMAERIDGGYIGITSETLSPGNAELATLRKQVTEYFGTNKVDPFKIESTGLKGLSEKNRKILERIMEDYPRLQSNPNYPGRDEVQGLIARYIELIGRCRDLERPSGAKGLYRSMVDDSNPMFRYTKYLKIFGNEAAEKELADKQISPEEISTFWAGIENKNNFSGYYELTCFFPETEEISISIFLDKNGIAHIPGIDKNHPLFNQIWMLTLESLALKVVPELKPYVRLLRGKSGKKRKSKDPLLKSLSLNRSTEMSAMTLKKRVCCVHLAIQGAGRGTRNPERSLAELDDITSAFNIVELTEQAVTEWPIFMKVDKRYVRVSGLLHKKEDKTYIDPIKLREILRDVEVEGDELVAIEALNQAVREQLTEALKIQVLNGRAYRMPVDFKIPEHGIAIGKDGEEYFKVPAGNKRGDTVTIDGKLYRLVKVPPHEKVKIGDKTYHAVPWQMSADQQAIYTDTSSISIEFEPMPVAYFVLYDINTGEILAKACPGPYKVDPSGNHGDVKTQRYVDAHERGEFACFLDDGVKASLEGRKADLAEQMFTVNSNIGYRQGVFPKLWKYLTSGRNVKDAAVRLLLDAMKQKLDSAGYKEFVAQLEEEKLRIAQSSEAASAIEPSAVVPTKHAKLPVAKAKAFAPSTPLPSSAQRLRQAERSEGELRAYELGYGPNAHEYAGLRGETLYILDENNPLHQSHRRALNPDDGEVLVSIRRPNGTVSKCARSLLKPKA